MGFDDGLNVNPAAVGFKTGCARDAIMSYLLVASSVHGAARADGASSFAQRELSARAESP